MFSFFKNKVFDLEKYLVDDLGYSKNCKISAYTEYTKGRCTILIFNEDKIGYKNLVINFDELNMVTLRFLPNSRIMFDMILNCIKNEVEKNEEL